MTWPNGTERAIVTILRELRQAGRTVVCVHHDLQTVPEYYDWVVLLNMRLIAAGPVEDAFVAENLHRTYGGRLAILEKAATSLLKTRKGARR
jgi:manganese/zinc/iron transport system ATP- binding protein